MKNSIFARIARAFFIFWHFEDVLVLSTTWNDLFCSCVDDVSIWWQMFKSNSRAVKRHFSSIMTLNNWKMIAEKRSYIFRWRSRFRRHRVCLTSLIWQFHAVVCQTTSKHCTKKRATRAARLFFFIQPIKSLICGVVVDVAVVKSLTP